MTQLALSLQFAAGCRAHDWPISRPRLRRLMLASLPVNCVSAAITLAIIGRTESQRLNREFRKKDAPTNILTFPYAAPPELHADLALCLPVARAEARALGRPLDHHLAHLVVHGTLHACGMDHLDEDEATQMEALEAAILQRFHIANPYSDRST